MNWYFEVLKKYFVFEGRAHRTEFWMFFLWTTVATIALMLIDYSLGWFNSDVSIGLLSGAYVFATLFPQLGVGARRLHDTNRSGWWQLLNLIPIVGFIILIVWWATDGDPADNQHGPNPKTASPVA